MENELRERETIWMVGHSNHPIELFLELLTKNEIRTLVDVRSIPRSRYSQFCRDNLEVFLASRGIRYYHSPKLGGKYPVPEEEREAALRKWFPPKGGRIAMMCSEGDYRECHRHYLLVPALRRMGFRAIQILKDGSTEEDCGPAKGGDAGPQQGGSGDGDGTRSPEGGKPNPQMELF